ncbi:hypothetical protein DES45_10535 [Microvirga subterranea]|uniref:Peptidase M48-like protein n=1 Tax=Microvirga subterranea TaxID=186651 RepID=A0A370HNM8_9HYPH|nr:hypothetical protein DES45_10535 [Microvirga subterranea]
MIGGAAVLWNRIEVGKLGQALARVTLPRRDIIGPGRTGHAVLRLMLALRQAAGARSVPDAVLLLSGFLSARNRVSFRRLGSAEGNQSQARAFLSAHPVTDQRLKLLERQVPARSGAPLFRDGEWRALKEICKTT